MDPTLVNTNVLLVATWMLLNFPFSMAHPNLIPSFEILHPFLFL